MANGFNQALVMVKEFNGSFDFMILGGDEIGGGEIGGGKIGTWRSW